MEALLSTLSVGLNVNRYLSAAAVTVVLWDHLITFDEEYQAVWRNKKERTLWKSAYLICRYASDAIMVLTACILSGSVDLSLTVCHGWIWCFVWLGLCFIAFTQVLVGHRILTLWDHRRSIRYSVFGIFIIFIIASAVLAVLASMTLQSNVIYLDFVRSCTFSKKEKFVPWIIGLFVGFDLFLVVMTIANALDMPRKKNMEILARLNRDGGRSFLALFILLFITLSLIIWGTLTTAYMLLPPAWAFSSVITSRLFCRVNLTQKKRTKAPKFIGTGASTSGFMVAGA